MVIANPAIENAARELFAQLNIYKDLKFYPSDLTSNLANQYGVSSSQVLVNKFVISSASIPYSRSAP